MNNNLHCHIGRAFTLDEREDKFKAARESMSRELTEALKHGEEYNDEVWRACEQEAT